MVGLKQMTDFNQSIYNSMVNYGKNANDYNNSFSTMNNAWTNIYNSWMNTMNTSYDTFSQNIKNPFNADEVFGVDLCTRPDISSNILSGSMNQLFSFILPI